MKKHNNITTERLEVNDHLKNTISFFAIKPEIKILKKERKMIVKVLFQFHFKTLPLFL